MQRTKLLAEAAELENALLDRELRAFEEGHTRQLRSKLDWLKIQVRAQMGMLNDPSVRIVRLDLVAADLAYLRRQIEEA